MVTPSSRRMRRYPPGAPRSSARRRLWSAADRSWRASCANASNVRRRWRCWYGRPDLRADPVPAAGVLTGIPQPDFAITVRSAPPDTTLVVKAPPFDPVQAALDADAGKGNLDTARVVGFDGHVGGAFKNYYMTPNAGHALQLPFVHRKDPAPFIPIPKIVAEVPRAAVMPATSSLAST